MLAIRSVVINGFKRLKARAAMNAIKKFVRGPAIETRAMSFLGSRKLKGSTGTGLAPPKITGELVRIKINGRIKVIIGSTCGIGFKVSLPRSFAVGSPSFSATKPCAISCSIAEKISIINEMNIKVKSINVFYQICWVRR